MKLTDKVPYVRVDQTVGQVDRAIELNKALTDLRTMGLISDIDHCAITERLHERYHREMREENVGSGLNQSS